MNTLVRSIGSTIASAVTGAVLAHMTMTMGQVTLPSESGFRVALVIAAAAAVLAVIVAAMIPAGRADEGTATQEGPSHTEESGRTLEFNPVPQGQ